MRISITVSSAYHCILYPAQLQEGTTTIATTKIHRLERNKYKIQLFTNDTVDSKENSTKL